MKSTAATVLELEALEDQPDSAKAEGTILCLPGCGVVMRLEAPGGTENLIGRKG